MIGVGRLNFQLCPCVILGKLTSTSLSFLICEVELNSTHLTEQSLGDITREYVPSFNTESCCCCLDSKSSPTLLGPHGLQPTTLLCSWDFPCKDTGMVCHFLLQGIPPTKGSNLGLLHCRQILYSWSQAEKPLLSVITSHLFASLALQLCSGALQLYSGFCGS